MIDGDFMYLIADAAATSVQYGSACGRVAAVTLIYSLTFALVTKTMSVKL